MSQGDLERELDRRRRELVGSLLQACRDERTARQAAGPVDRVSSAPSGASTTTGNRFPAGCGSGARTTCGAALAAGRRSLPHRGHRRAGRHDGSRPHRRQGCSGGVFGHGSRPSRRAAGRCDSESGAGCSCSDRTCVRRRVRLRSILGCGMRSHGCGHVERCLPPPALLPPPSRRRLRRPMRPSPRPGPSPFA